MLFRILSAFFLVGVTVTLHAGGLGLLLRRLMSSNATSPGGSLHVTGLLIRVTWWLILIHGAGIVVWAAFYFLQGCMPDVESALYFSGSTYTTVGFGDLVLPKPWRMLGPVEALTGILMCGLSTGFFFAVVYKIVRARSENEPN